MSTPKKRGVLFLSPEDMQEAKKSMKEKGIEAEDVKNLPPIEEIHGLNLPPVEEVYDLNYLFTKEPPDIPTQVVKVNSSIDMIKLKSLLLKLLVSAWMSLMTLCLSKMTLMLTLVDN